MALEKGGYAATEVKELLAEILRHRTIDSIASQHVSPAACYRRVYDIMHDRVSRVSLRVADELATAAGHPEWLQIL